MPIKLEWSPRQEAGGRWSGASGFLTIVSAAVTVLTPIGTVVAIILVHSADIPITILAIYICLLTTALLLLFVRQEGRHHQQLVEQQEQHHKHILDQEARFFRAFQYAPATVPIRKAFACLVNASWVMFEGDQSKDLFVEHLRHGLQFIAEAFGLITDSPCRASIKMVSAMTEGDTVLDARVFTLCRSDEEDQRDDSPYDKVGNNTDFRQIFEEGSGYFLCNDLPAELVNGYQNSHWTQNVVRTQAFRYRSTIVCAISRDRARMEPANPRSGHDVIGFLCIDTPTTNCFKETYDVPICMAFAGVLYLALKQFGAVDTYPANARYGAAQRHNYTAIDTRRSND